MILKRVAIRNYKSIKNIDLEMQGLTCLVGPNNSGKSNLIDAFAFLRDMSASNLSAALEARDPSRLCYYGADPMESVAFEVDFATANQPHSRYSLNLDSDCRRVESERLIVFREGKEESLFSAVTQNNAWQVRFGQSQSSSARGEMVSPLFEVWTPPYPEAKQVRRLLSSFQFYRFVPAYLKRPGQAQRVDRLDREGGNFSAYVHTIQSSHKKSFARIEGELRKNLPDIEELGTHLTQSGTTEVMIKERWFDRTAYGFQLSDGLVGFLAHLVALYGPDSPALVVFEEPENYIHPRLMERLVDMLKGAAKTKQVIISTHSVPLINQLSLKDLLIIERGPDGATNARRIGARKDLEEALKEWALGEAYVSGALDAA